MCKLCQDMPLYRDFAGSQTYLACMAALRRLLTRGGSLLLATCDPAVVQDENDIRTGEIRQHVVRCGQCGQLFTVTYDPAQTCGSCVNAWQPALVETPGKRKVHVTLIRQLGALAPPDNGWCKTLYFLSWDGREPVYDIRTWTADHRRFGKGVTVTAGELAVLRRLLDTQTCF